CPHNSMTTTCSKHVPYTTLIRSDRWLQGGIIVVCDRYRASSIAYGEAQGLEESWLATVQQYLPVPSLTILLDIAPDTAVQCKSILEKHTSELQSRSYFVFCILF